MVNQKSNIIFTGIGIIYLFFNSLLLPEGLLYTALLSPLLFIYLLKVQGFRIYFIFLLITTLFILIQYPFVTDWYYYFRSFILFQCVAIFIISAYYAIRETLNLGFTFKILASVNLFLLALAVFLLFIPSLRPTMWYLIPISPGIPSFPRLKMFTYEASYYALIIMPVFAYYLLRKLLLSGRTGILFISLAVALLLSCSFGVLAGIGISLFLLFILNLQELKSKIKLNYLSLGALALLGVFLMLYFFLPDNFLFERIHNIFSGKDTSARGRTTEAFTLAWNIAKMKSICWGIGPGQLKIIGRDYIIQFYHYSNIPEPIRIPNAVAETLNIYGLVGIAIRFGLIVYLFFKTKVWTNYYRLFLFLFIFIYQFTGSFIFNVAEYIIWALSFCPALFPEFNRRLLMPADSPDKR
jgi:hypothetical protein